MAERYKKPTGGRPWTPEEDDIILDSLVQAVSAANYAGRCDVLAAQLDRGNRKRPDGSVDGELVRRRAWGLAIRAAEYKPTPGACQRYALDLAFGKAAVFPATFGELYLVKQSLLEHAKGERSDRRPDAVYLAALLRRPVPFVDAIMRRVDPRRRLGGGFGLGGKK